MCANGLRELRGDAFGAVWNMMIRETDAYARAKRNDSRIDGYFTRRNAGAIGSSAAIAIAGRDDCDGC